MTGSSKGPEEGSDLDKLVSVQEILNILAWDSWCCDFFSPLQIASEYHSSFDLNFESIRVFCMSNFSS